MQLPMAGVPVNRVGKGRSFATFLVPVGIKDHGAPHQFGEAGTLLLKIFREPFVIDIHLTEVFEDLQRVISEFIQVTVPFINPGLGFFRIGGGRWRMFARFQKISPNFS